MKIGLFGGSFNPPHKIHKQIMEYLLNNYLDKIIVIPTGNHYPKSTLIPFAYRFNMITTMCNKNINIKISDYESKNKPVYTYQAIDYFKNKYPGDDIYFVMGADNFKDFENWKNYQYMLENDKFIVVNREEDITKYKQKYNQYINNFTFINMEKPKLSSTDIRENIKNKNFNILKEELDKKVIEYILENDLYIL